MQLVLVILVVIALSLFWALSQIWDLPSLCCKRIAHPNLYPIFGNDLTTLLLYIFIKRRGEISV